MAALDMVFNQLEGLLTQAPDGNDTARLLHSLEHDYNFEQMHNVEAQIGEFDFNADIQENGERYLQILWDGIDRVTGVVRRMLFSCMDSLAQNHTIRGYLVNNRMGDLLDVLLRQHGQTDEEEWLVARILTRCARDKELDLFIAPASNDRVPAVLRRALNRHADDIDDESRMGLLAFEEELSLLAAIYVDYPEKTDDFIRHIELVIDVLVTSRAQTRPLDRPVASLLLCLTRLIRNPTRLANLRVLEDLDARTLLEILEDALDYYDMSVRNIHLERLIKVIYAVHTYGAMEDRIRIRVQLIPSFAERRQILGQGNTLVHKFISVIHNGRDITKAVFGILMLALSSNQHHHLAYNYGFSCAAEILNVLRIQIPTLASLEQLMRTDPATEFYQDHDTLTGQLRDEMYGPHGNPLVRVQMSIRANQVIRWQTAMMNATAATIVAGMAAAAAGVAGAAAPAGPAGAAGAAGPAAPAGLVAPAALAAPTAPVGPDGFLALTELARISAENSARRFALTLSADSEASTIIAPENQPAAPVEGPEPNPAPAQEPEQPEHGTLEMAMLLLAKVQPNDIVESVEVDEENEDVDTDFNMEHGEDSDVDMDM